jgi:orotidine-5'-phosphate decarboxylase
MQALALLDLKAADIYTTAADTATDRGLYCRMQTIV